jgi:hypothetical protein
VSKSPFFTNLTDQYTSSEYSQIDSTQENLQIQTKHTFDNIEEEFDMADENVNVDQIEIFGGKRSEKKRNSDKKTCTPSLL